MDDVKLVVANRIENVVALLGLKVSELFSFQSLLFPLLVPWQDPDNSSCQCLASALDLSQPK